MKNLTNKFILSVLSLVLTGVALSVGVYAWFTVNNTANVDTFNAQIRAGDGFYISVDGTDWKSTITATDLALNPAFRFDAVTSDDGISFTRLVDNDGEFETPSTTSGYIEFELFFVSSVSVSTIELTEFELNSEVTNWIAGVVIGAPINTTADQVIPGYAHHAARVSFTDESNDSAVVFQAPGGSGNTTNFGSILTNKAVRAYNAIMANPITSSEFEVAVGDGEDIEGYDGLAQVFSTAVVVAQLSTQDAEPAIAAEINVDPTITGTIGENYKVGKVTVRVWIEGWDQEAFNAILSGILETEFSFVAAT